MTDARFTKLIKLMEQFQVDVIALNPGPSLTYLTGLHFHLMERPTVLLIAKDREPLLILPELEAGKISTSRARINAITYNDDPATWQKSFKEAAGVYDLTHARVGIEAIRLRYLELEYLQKAAPEARFISAEKVFSNLRETKDASEIQQMRLAVKIAQEALSAILPRVKAGVTEKEIAAELTIQLLRGGSDPELPFAPIVASGANSANPHATPSDRRLKAGDLVVIDWGARSNGYCSDLTRTFAIGDLEPELRTIYEIVRKSNLAGRVAGKPEITAGNVDKASRDVIENAGYGVYFNHRTGHGIGLEDHETPYIFNGNSTILSPGHAYTVEPGIYLPGRGGVRIEDDMIITATGSESLSDFSRELTIL
jgi:Xaa-Pro dipeptidase